MNAKGYLDFGLARGDLLPPMSISRRALWVYMTLLPVAAMGGVGLIQILQADTMLAKHLTVGHVVLAVALFVASLTDIMHRKIYNWMTYPTLLWLLVLSMAVTVGDALQLEVSWLGPLGLAKCLVGIVGSGAVMLIAYSMSRGGAGDVKLMMVIGGLAGLEIALWVIGVAYILAASCVVVCSIAEGSLRMLASALGRKVASACWPGFVLAPSADQQRQLSRPVPLAGFFFLATYFVMQ